MQSYQPKHMAYSPRREAAYRAGLALGLSAALLWTTPALAAESASAAQGNQAASAASEASTSAVDAVSAASSAGKASISSSEQAAEDVPADNAKTSADTTAAAGSADTSSDAAMESAAEAAEDAAGAATEEGSAEGAAASDAAEADNAAADSSASSASDSAAAASETDQSATTETDTATSNDAAEEQAGTATARRASVMVAATASSSTASEETTLDGYEIAASQSSLDVSEVPGDFVIIKATEGMVFTTSYYQEKAEEALAAGKLLGFYHFARTGSTAEEQAEYFVNAIQDYIGKAVLFLDWENTSYSDIRSEGTDWCKTWLDTVYELTGVRALIYLNKYATTEYDFSNIASDYKLWVAQYADTQEHDGYQDDPWTSSSGYGAWTAPTIFQYSSTTHLSGFSGNLDVDKFYGSASDWDALAASDLTGGGGESLSDIQASYASLSDGLYEIESALAPGLDIEIRDGSTSNGGAIQTYAENSTISQRWYLARQSDGSYTIRNVKSGLYLDVPGAHAVSQQTLQEYTGNSTLAQRWFILDHDGTYEIVSALNRSLAVDVTGASTISGTTIQLYTRNNTAAQRFTFDQIVQEIEEAVYTITSKSSNKAVDVDSASLESGANVWQYASNGTAAQEFQIEYDAATGYYTIRNINSGKVLDVAGGSFSSGNGTNVWQYESNGTDAQRWAVTKNSDGSYTFISALNGRVLDLAGASQNSGANIWIYDYNGTNAQKWVLTQVIDWLQEGVYQIISEVNHSNAVAARSASGQALYMAARSSGSSSEKWYLTKTSDGYVKLTNVASGLVLDLTSASAANGTPVQTYTSNGTDAQLWKVVVSDNGYELVSKVSSSYAIDVPGASTSPNTALWIYKRNDTDAQKWHLVSVGA